VKILIIILGCIDFFKIFEITKSDFTEQVVDNIGVRPSGGRHRLILMCSPTSLNFEPRTLIVPKRVVLRAITSPTPDSDFTTCLTFKPKIK
jgi:hypothetical protein